MGEGRGGLLAESVVWSDLVYPVYIWCMDGGGYTGGGGGGGMTIWNKG